MARTDRAEKRANSVYCFIITHKKEYDGNSPTYQQIMSACDISTESMVTFYLERLQRDGLIELKARRILVVRGVWRLEEVEQMAER